LLVAARRICSNYYLICALELHAWEPCHLDSLTRLFSVASVHGTNRTRVLATIGGNDRGVDLSRRRRRRYVPLGFLSRLRSGAALFGSMALLRLVFVARVDALAVVLLVESTTLAAVFDRVLARYPLFI